MFPRIATVKRGSKTYKYLQIVEAYRANGRTTQRVVANLGRLDQLDGKLDDLLVALSKYAKHGKAALPSIRSRRSDRLSSGAALGCRAADTSFVGSDAAG